MSENTLPRRGFLRSLVSLPMLGGGLTLIGAPTAIAEPVTEALFQRYAAWISREHAELLVEGVVYSYPEPQYLGVRREQQRLWAETLSVFRSNDPVAVAHTSAAPPSTRAALVLSAVGCDWRV